MGFVTFMKVFPRLFVLITFLFLVACSESNREPQEKYTPLATIDLQSAKPVIIGSNEGIGILYSDKRGVIYKSKNAELVLDSLPGSDHWLYADKSNIYAIWWLIDNTSTKQKSIMFSKSSDDGKSFSKAVKLNSKADALGEVSIVSDGANNIVIAYVDERQPGRFIYSNRSEDAGKTWLTEDLRLDSSLAMSSIVVSNSNNTQPFATSVKLGLVNKSVVAVWQQADIIDNQPVMRIVSKTSADFGKTWGETQLITLLPKPEAVELNAVAGSTGMYVVFGLPDAGGMGLYELMPGGQWKAIDSSQIVTKESYSGWFRPIISGNNLIIVFMEEKQGTKNKVKVATYLAELGAWSGLPLDVDKDKGHDLTRSGMPAVIATDKEVMVVWEDYRPLIPSIYATVSKDNGKTWLSHAKPLTTDGLTINNLPSLATSKDKVWLFYITGQPTAEKAKPFYAYQELAVKDGLIQIPEIKLSMPSNEKRREMLIDRANKFWALREERNWEATWEYMEPLYRQRFDKKEWVFNQDRLTYSKTVVDEGSVDIVGNFGSLKANVDVGLTNQVGKNGLIEATPAETQSLNMRWGWFYDNWYFVPDVIFGNHLKF